MKIEEYIALIDGKDEKGLIYKITGAIYHLNLNIISNSEFVDPETNHFFMRSHFVGGGHPDNLCQEIKKVLPPHFNVRIIKSTIKRIVVMVTKEHHCLADLLIRDAYNTLNASIVSVIGNFNDLEPLVKKFQKPYHFIPINGKSREDHEQEIIKIIDQYKPDYIVLAKFMRVLTPAFVNHYKNRIINIHHSFLPAFIGANPYEQAYQRGVKIIGATSHFVNEKLDDGAIIVQEVVPIDHHFTVKDMQQRGCDVEVLALSKALKYVFEDRVFINGRKTVIFK